MKKYFIVLAILCCAAVAVVTLSTVANASISYPAAVKGWAWSSTIGWIQTDTGQANPVTLGADGYLTGYAWSSNIGWIKFDPVGASPRAQVLADGQVVGFIRACSGTVNKDCNEPSRTDGWDGWIELSGTNHVSDSSGLGGVYLDKTTGIFKGYAWGGNVVGWVQFNTAVGMATTSVHVDVQEDTVTAECTANIASPININPGGSVTFTGNVTSPVGLKWLYSWALYTVGSYSATGNTSETATYATKGTYYPMLKVQRSGYPDTFVACPQVVVGDGGGTGTSTPNTEGPIMIKFKGYPSTVTNVKVRVGTPVTVQYSWVNPYSCRRVFVYNPSLLNTGWQTAKEVDNLSGEYVFSQVSTIFKSQFRIKCTNLDDGTASTSRTLQLETYDMGQGEY